ncbi:hypothetical protein [Tautonia plasticadhaerens]|uniref:Uncharacterized protein n=1 Tax=Tautonia plasticadhaerens TaxID=2527974 RepID=A0A518H0I4_9BACT|nr:hypothetical protein [Tautonia plasticadhaerens]QDV34356.1 hypothetical protein ElP_22410 [Tautonia plasticadhaerens]
MRPIVRPPVVVRIGLVALALGFGGGCGGEPNDPGIEDMESKVAPDAPTNMGEFYEQQKQMQGGAAAPSS